jgi:hypothetical protein
MSVAPKPSGAHDEHAEKVEVDHLQLLLLEDSRGRPGEVVQRLSLHEPGDNEAADAHESADEAADQAPVPLALPARSRGRLDRKVALSSIHPAMNAAAIQSTTTRSIIRWNGPLEVCPGDDRNGEAAVTTPTTPQTTTGGIRRGRAAAPVNCSPRSARVGERTRLRR